MSTYHTDRLAHVIEWAASPNNVRHDEEKPDVVAHAFLAQSTPLGSGDENRHAEQVCIATSVMSIDFWKTKQTSGVRCPLCIAILTEGLLASAEHPYPHGEICSECGQKTLPGSTVCLSRPSGREGSPCRGKPPEGRKYWRYADGALSHTESLVLRQGRQGKEEKP